MKKHLLMAVGCAAIGTVNVVATRASESDSDTLRMIKLQEVEVVSTRATAKTPMVYTNVNKEQIAKINYGQDLPFLLMLTPSVVATSDAGAGIGYTGIRVRGTDATRINVTTNGIPMNDSESHSLFWVNTPDIASSVDDIQIQRGVGTSTNGAGAFGGSINMKTESLSTTPMGEVSGSYGSFNTHKEMIKVNTGLINNHWAFSARLSNIQSDGYIDRASTDLKSYFAQAGYYGKNTVVKFITFGGTEKTYHAWGGIDAAQMKKDRRYNPCGEIEVIDADGKAKVVGFFDDQTDNYTQRNYQLLFTQILSQNLSLNVNFHYTDGDGYYQEYKNRRTLKEYGLLPFEIDGETVKKSDLVRRKQMDNGFGGGVFSLDYKSEGLELSFGGAVNNYSGDHFGRVIWVQNYYNTKNPRKTNHEYYRNNSDKTDANVYIKGNYEVVRGLNIYADLQYRHISHKIQGANDNWDWINEKMQGIDVNRTFNFFNPKAGLFYKINKQSNVYASFAVAQKEPTRNNYTDAKEDAKPLAERLYDYEFGYNYASQRFSAGVNFYYMNYKNQFVLTGENNEIGEPLADNVPDSYRMGVELSAGVQIAKWLRWDVNATFSKNIIENYSEYVYHLDESWDPTGEVTTTYMGNATISFSPSVIANSIISAELRGWNAAFTSSYVSKQYLTNFEQSESMLEGYFVNNLNVAYTFKLPVLRSLSVGVSVNNIFNEMYSSNGWGGSNYLSTGERYNSAGFFPMAGTNVLANVVIKF